MTKKLSEREVIVLRAILKATEDGYGGTGSKLRQASLDAGIDATEAGCHRTAASLCRKLLVSRAGTPKLQWYRITQTGRDTLDGKGYYWRVP